MTHCPSKKQSQVRKKSIPCQSSQAQHYELLTPKTALKDKLSHNDPDISSKSQFSSRKSDEVKDKTYFNCQNYFLRKTILVMYKFFEKRERSWNLEHLCYKNMILLLKELRYVKQIEFDSSPEQSQELKKCYYLWINLAQGRHICLENLLIVLCHIEHLQIDESILKEVIVELQKGISKFQEEQVENGNPNFIFLCKREGWKFQNEIVRLTDKQIKDLRKQLDCLKFTRWTQNNPNIKYQEESEESYQVHFMSKKSVQLANNKRRKILEELRQRQNKVQTIQLHHILNYKQQKIKLAVSKLEECDPLSEEKKIKKQLKIEKKPLKETHIQKKKQLKNFQKKGKLNSNKQNRNISNSHIKGEKQVQSSSFGNVLGQDLGLSEITKTQIIQEIDSIDDIPGEDNFVKNYEQLNNNDILTNFLPQSLILPESQQEKKRRQYIDIPMLYVDVNIEEGKKERIVVYDGDTAKQLAIVFGKKHDLSYQTIQRLESMLKQQIGSVLCKIDQALQEDCSYLY